MGSDQAVKYLAQGPGPDSGVLGRRLGDGGKRHAGDARPYVYSPAALEAAATHSELWNAAQRQLVREGRLHGYMGITDAFNASADFSQMGTLKNGGLCIGNVLHKTYITVNENGTRAGAATSVGMTSC